MLRKRSISSVLSSAAPSSVLTSYYRLRLVFFSSSISSQLAFLFAFLLYCIFSYALPNALHVSGMLIPILSLAPPSIVCVLPPSVTSHFRLPLFVSGTVCLGTSPRCVEFSCLFQLVLLQTNNKRTALFISHWQTAVTTYKWSSPSRRTTQRENVYSSYIAPCQDTHKALRHGSHSFTCKLHHACLLFSKQSTRSCHS